jgi:hypothetical protein
MKWFQRIWRNFSRFMIGLSKYFDLILRIIMLLFSIQILSSGIVSWCYFSLCDSWIKYGFIPIYGILGSAFATLLSITLYSLAKLMFVVKRLQLYPFTNQTLYSNLDVCFVFLLLFLAISFNPIIAIGLKSILVMVLYVYVNYKFMISTEINQVVDTVLKNLK